jgi:hypothetical protein
MWEKSMLFKGRNSPKEKFFLKTKGGCLSPLCHSWPQLATCQQEKKVAGRKDALFKTRQASFGRFTGEPLFLGCEESVFQPQSHWKPRELPRK